MDGKSERTIQVPEDMLWVCVVYFSARWDPYLPLVEFAYKNNYHSNIQMASFETLYGRRYRSPIGSFNSVVVDSLDSDLLRDAIEQVRLIQGRLLIAQSLQKSYADRQVRPLVFMVGNQVISLDSVEMSPVLNYEEEPVAILYRHVRKLRTKEITLMKVLWLHRLMREATGEIELDMRAHCPHLFKTPGGTLHVRSARSRGHNEVTLAMLSRSRWVLPRS
ncbi:uncharacterized protein LOC129890611 [Solanum dulcamara]|uniref:uncharacterized protein LOC129890611 n=1 Tax=Solanum dulcamara TaxID=45834 RepID=UPI0024857725|nr:uncharacterized protein LOC129890611 [Solanum dulcamara]